MHICIGGQSNPYNNTGKNIAVSVVIHSVILSFNVFNLYIVYPTKKETHHLELFNSQEDHKGYASLVCISAKVCEVLLRHTSFAIWRQKCVKENWS